MSDNVVDITQRLKQIKADTNLAVPVEAYRLDSKALLMDVSFQVDYLLTIATHEYASGELNASHIHRLLKVFQHLYTGVILPFEARSYVVVRHLPGEKDSIAYSVHNWAMPLERMANTPQEEEKRFSYRLEAGLIELDDKALLEPCSIYPPEWMDFDIPEDDAITARLPKHIVKKMNELVVTNSGRGILASDGTYTIVLPSSERFSLVVVLELDRPIALLPEDQRQSPK